ncbi:MAG: hypothetical protein J6B88_02190 [Clostridia bacterium]|nr:hypothetical protein [Clostridia bacterium]
MKSRALQSISGTARGGRNGVGAEYPPAPTKTETDSSESVFCFVAERVR